MDIGPIETRYIIIVTLLSVLFSYIVYKMAKCCLLGPLEECNDEVEDIGDAFSRIERTQSEIIEERIEKSDGLISLASEADSSQPMPLTPKNKALLRRRGWSLSEDATSAILEGLKEHQLNVKKTQ
jgi:hypothetical protein